MLDTANKIMVKKSMFTVFLNLMTTERKDTDLIIMQKKIQALPLVSAMEDSHII